MSSASFPASDAGRLTSVVSSQLFLEGHQLPEFRDAVLELLLVHFEQPLDRELLGDIARRIPAIVTVEDNVIQGGFGSAVLEALQEMNMTDVAVKTHGLPDTYIEHGTPSELYALVQLDAAGIAGVVAAFLSSRHHHGIPA